VSDIALYAGDIMTDNLITVSPDEPATKAASIMVDNKISGLPVVGQDGKLHGIITEMDLLGLLREHNGEGKYVYDFMTKEVIAFNIEDSIIEISEFFMKSKIRRVPVINNNSEIVGVVSRRDILKQILKQRHS
jgi:CBS domain-containing membrane protein